MSTLNAVTLPAPATSRKIERSFLFDKPHSTLKVAVTSICGEGHIVVSDPTSESVSEDIYRTILYWGFHFPDDEKPYERYNWRIYGNITTDQAIVIEYTPRSYEQIKETAFLVYKDRAALELNKRRGDIRKLFAKARETIEATKDEKGYYHPYKDAGEWISQLYDSHLYRVIASQEHARLSSELLHV
jgi:hypothetical protein